MVWNEVVKRQPRASAILRAARPSGLGGDVQRVRHPVAQHAAQLAAGLQA